MQKREVLSFEVFCPTPLSFLCKILLVGFLNLLMIFFQCHFFQHMLLWNCPLIFLPTFLVCVSLLFHRYSSYFFNDKLDYFYCHLWKEKKGCLYIFPSEYCRQHFLKYSPGLWLWQVIFFSFLSFEISQ